MLFLAEVLLKSGVLVVGLCRFASDGVVCLAWGGARINHTEACL